MKSFPTFFFLISGFVLHAQTDVRVEKDSTGANSALDIDKDLIDGMCECARDESRKLFKKISSLTSFEEAILLYEGYHEENQLINMIQSDQESVYKIIRTAWNEKWSKVYCITDSSGIYGYLDRMLLFSYQQKAFLHLYDPQWPIKANINRLVNYDPYEEVRKNPVTIRDFVERMLREKQGQIAYRQSLETDIKGILEKLISYGGKKASELTTEELEIELGRARKEGKLSK